MNASPAFIAKVTKAAHTEIEEFKKYFPNDKIELIPGTIPWTCELRHDFGGTSLANVRLSTDPIRRLFIFEFGISPNLSKAIPAILQNGELVLDVRDTGISSFESLIEYILLPVLFPAKVNDSSTIQHLQPRFGAR